MKLLKEKVYDFLNQFVENKLLSCRTNISEAFTMDKSVDILGNNFVLNCWEENIDEGSIVCVELSRKKTFFLSEAYSLGVLYSDGIVKKLGQDDMWKLGF